MNEQTRLTNKLALFNQPGFFQFLQDLGRTIGDIFLVENAQLLKQAYEQRLKELGGDSKFIQTELPL